MSRGTGGATGASETSGNDIIVSLSPGTFLHEPGHDFDSHHGGLTYHYNVFGHFVDVNGGGAAPAHPCPPDCSTSSSISVYFNRNELGLGRELGASSFGPAPDGDGLSDVWETGQTDPYGGSVGCLAGIDNNCDGVIDSTLAEYCPWCVSSGVSWRHGDELPKESLEFVFGLVEVPYIPMLHQESHAGLNVLRRHKSSGTPDPCPICMPAD